MYTGLQSKGYILSKKKAGQILNGRYNKVNRMVIVGE